MINEHNVFLPEEKQLVFVYGSLQQGFYNHQFIQKAKGIFVNKYKTVEKYGLYDMGEYPAAWWSGDTQIKGELYIVDELDTLDWLEGYPKYYNRIKVQLERDKKEVSPEDEKWVAWMYFYNPIFHKEPDEKKLIKTGKWRW